MSSIRTDASAQGQAEPDGCVLPRFVADERPDPDGPPTRVSVGLIVADILSIDDRNQTITVDAFYALRWVDPRLAGLAGCRFPFDAVGNPGLRLINAGRLFTRLGEQAVITEGGTVSYRLRLYGALSAPHRLDEFPFDHDTFKIRIQSLTYDDTAVELVIDEGWTGRRLEEFTIADWSVGQPVARVFSAPIPLFEGTYSRYEFSIPADREPGYYVWKVILPLLLIVAMSWGVFWIDPTQFGPPDGPRRNLDVDVDRLQFRPWQRFASGELLHDHGPVYLGIVDSRLPRVG